ncbi:MAG: YtfJ family protein [Gammaproteobacteria bacterium]|nr:YtfJ family protein [Gammaproteobacteria bacterium]
MMIKKAFLSAVLLLSSSAVVAQLPTLESPLPALEIADLGELKYEDNEFSYTPWNSGNNPGKVHIVQYFAGTKADSERFKPFVDLLEETFGLGNYHVTTIINLDAALWGTTGFVVSEVKDSKREYPLSTIVLDEEGAGAQLWELGEEGAGLAILDEQGIVRYFTRYPMSPDEMDKSLDLVRSSIDS